MHPNIAGALINSAIYLLCVFVAGVVTAHPIAWKSALIAMGVTYLSHYAGAAAAYREPADRAPWLYAAHVSVAASILLGASAGVSLLF